MVSNEVRIKGPQEGSPAHWCFVVLGLLALWTLGDRGEQRAAILQLGPRGARKLSSCSSALDPVIMQSDTATRNLTVMGGIAGAG